jgi:nitrite reductase/ring-hydroxylating ferredoxin subunit/uncharacterized membrane protein
LTVEERRQEERMAVETREHFAQQVTDLVDEQGSWLDPLSETLQNGLTSLLEAGGERARSIKSFFNGVWLGHPLHPAISDAPVGAWFTGFILDVVGARKGADAAVTAGIVAAVPTALAGVADWHDTIDRDRRVGMAHALLNSAALTLFVGSALARRRGARGLGVSLSTAGLAIAMGGAYLGGDLVFSQGTNVRHNAWDPEPREWKVAGRTSDLAEGKLTGGEIEVDGRKVPVVLLKRGSQVFALNGTCAHAGGPLAEGKVVGEACVQCPWHGSEFDMRTGEVVQGPSAYPQPVYHARIRGEDVEVRLAR